MPNAIFAAPILAENAARIIAAAGQLAACGGACSRQDPLESCQSNCVR